MLSILVACSKGGCGKTTVATHLAAYFALAGKRTALVDVDPQHSALRWCERRAGLEHAVLGIDGQRRGWRKQVPDDTQRLVIDAPAGALAAQLQAYLEEVDAVVVPILPSVFDMEAVSDFLTSLGSNERIRRRKLPVALIGNRLKPWTNASSRAVSQIETWPVPLVAQLRDSQAYVMLSGLGKSLFDYHSEQVRSHQADWDGLLQWLRKVNRAK